MMIGKFTDQLIEKFIGEFNKEANQEKLKIHVIDPLIYHILDRLYPYIIITAIIFILLFLVVFMILFILIKGNSSIPKWIRPHLS